MKTIEIRGKTLPWPEGCPIFRWDKNYPHLSYVWFGEACSDGPSSATLVDLESDKSCLIVAACVAAEWFEHRAATCEDRIVDGLEHLQHIDAAEAWRSLIDWEA